MRAFTVLTEAIQTKDEFFNALNFSADDFRNLVYYALHKRYGEQEMRSWDQLEADGKVRRYSELFGPQNSAGTYDMYVSMLRREGFLDYQLQSWDELLDAYRQGADRGSQLPSIGDWTRDALPQGDEKYRVMAQQLRSAVRGLGTADNIIRNVFAAFESIEDWTRTKQAYEEEFPGRNLEEDLKEMSDQTLLIVNRRLYDLSPSKTNPTQIIKATVIPWAEAVAWEKDSIDTEEERVDYFRRLRDNYIQTWNPDVYTALTTTPSENQNEEGEAQWTPAQQIWLHYRGRFAQAVPFALTEAVFRDISDMLDLMLRTIDQFPD